MNSLPLEQRLDQGAKLQRFVGKLLQEALHCKAEHICFSLRGSNLEVKIDAAGQVLKKVEIKSNWYLELLSFFAERLNYGFQGEKVSYEFDIARFLLRGSIAIRLPGGILTFQIETSEKLAGESQLTLSAFKLLNLAEQTHFLGFSDATRSAIEGWAHFDSGILLVAAPTSANLTSSLATITSLSGFQYAGRLDELTPTELALAAARMPLLAGVVAEDVSHAVLALRQQQHMFAPELFHTAICLALVPKTCSACARKTPVDRTLVDALPAEVRGASWEGYLVGRGCSQCGERGTRGSLALASMAIFDSALKQLVTSGAPEEEIVSALFKQGVRPLLEDGVRKVREGSTSLNTVLATIKTVPLAYLSLLKARDVVHKSAADESLFAATQLPKQAVRGQPQILVVEDDVDQSAILEMVLKNAGYLVEVVSNGKLGLASARGKLPDLILTDLMMPTMDGFEFVKALKADKELRAVPVIILTVLADGDKEYELLDLGADDYCEKTIQRKLLLKRIENVLRRRSK
jgi:CheY-like chemotaxis protein